MVGLSPPPTPPPHTNPTHIDRGGEMKGTVEEGGRCNEGGVNSSEEGVGGLPELLRNTKVYILTGGRFD